MFCVTSVQDKHVNLVHIESRKSKRRNSDFEIFVDCDSNNEQLKELTHLLRKHTNIVEMDPPDHSGVLEEGNHTQDTPGITPQRTDQESHRRVQTRNHTQYRPGMTRSTDQEFCYSTSDRLLNKQRLGKAEEGV